MPKSTIMQGSPGRGDGPSSQLVATIFTLSRDQRLSRWELLENPQPSSELPGLGTDGVSAHRGNSEKPCLNIRGGRGNFEQRSSETNRRVEVDVNVEDCSGRGEGGAVGTKTGFPAVEHGEDWRDWMWKGEYRWQLAWRAGCVVDVCDVSSMDVVALPVHEPQAAPLIDGYGSCTQTSNEHPRLIEDDLSTGVTASVTDAIDGRKNASNSPNARGQDAQGEEKRDVSSQSALVAVAGQGLQLVHFGGVG